MVCTLLSTPAMRQEKKDVSHYGAVRMTKKETTDIIRTNQMYPNFWVYVTIYDETEARGGTIQKMGY
eukprot:8678559-Heterocapsa_arctica.AAC.1